MAGPSAVGLRRQMGKALDGAIRGFTNVERAPHAYQRLRELERCADRASFLERFCGPPVARRILVPAILRLEGGFMFSRTLRRILARHNGVEVGRYTYGPCLMPDGLPPGTRLGRYTSLGPQVVVFRRNHPLERMSLHPFFYNPVCGIVGSDTIARDEENPLDIGNDVWIGARSIILPRCKRIADGAVVGAGSVVTRDVPEFAIVGGNPAKVIGWRYPGELQETVRRTHWWSRDIGDLLPHLSLFTDAATAERISKLHTGQPVSGQDEKPLSLVRTRWEER